MQRSFPLKMYLLVGLCAALLVGGYYVGEYYTYRLYEDSASLSSSDAGAGVASATDRGVPAGVEYAFVHRAAPDNISGNSTYLDGPLLEGDPDATISVTQNWNPGGGPGTYNDHSVGVWYDPGADRWAIFNQDRAQMPEGAAFNVVVLGGSPDGG